MTEREAMERLVDAARDFEFQGGRILAGSPYANFDDLVDGLRQAIEDYDLASGAIDT